jgi:hypothetical protein
LQLIDKKGEIAAVWMASVSKLGWMAGHIMATYKKEELMQSKNRVVGYFPFAGDPRLEQFHPFWISYSTYCRLVHLARPSNS